MIDAGGIAGDQLRQLVERIERLEEERKAISADIREVYAESHASNSQTACDGYWGGPGARNTARHL